MAKPKLNKADLSGIQSIVSQLQQQAGDGEVDANLITQLAEQVNVAVDQAGDVHDEVQEGAEGAAAASGTDLNPAPPPPPVEPNVEEPPEPEAQKVYGTRPPTVIMPGAASENAAAKLPQFIKALQGGSLRKAQEVADIRSQGQEAFDDMFKMAAKAIMDQEGISTKNIRAIHSGYVPQGPELQKAMTSGDLAGVNLMPLARLMMPVYAGLVQRIPVNTPENGSDKASWRVRMGFQNVDWAALLSTAEADNGQDINEPFTLFEVPYREVSVSDSVNVKAVYTAKGYDDPMQVSVMTALTIVLSGQEKKLLGDNAAAIAKPDAPTATADGTGTVGTATAKFLISALTYRGWLAQSKGGTGAVGETDASTASEAVDLSAAESVTVSWPSVPGAVAYNVYYNPSSTTKVYVCTVTVPTVTLKTLPTEGNAPSATNKSANANGYEGILSWCELSTLYTKSIVNKMTPVDLKGAKLTAGKSGINEIDNLLANLWSRWKIAPTGLLMSPLQAGSVTDLMMGLSQYRIELSAERGTISGGMFVSSYTNKFAPFADGTPRQVDVIPHPDMPDGTIAVLCETIPYKMSRETRGFAREPLIPYTYFPLGATKQAYPYTLFESDVCECFHPSVQTALMGVAL